MIITNASELTKPCKDASLFEAENVIKQLEDELKKSNHPGVGLAANQIGIDLKVCIIRSGKEKLDLVNPIITNAYDLSIFKNEGCLSFPGEIITTKRYNEILIHDLLHPAGIVCAGSIAVIIQHEVDHLNGKTMYDSQITIPDGPNALCFCQSGKKYKKCHYGKEIKH